MGPLSWDEDLPDSLPQHTYLLLNRLPAGFPDQVQHEIVLIQKLWVFAVLEKNQQDVVRRGNLIQNLVGYPREVEGHPVEDGRYPQRWYTRA